MTHYLFTSEAVSAGHPDKIADQISDAIVDACLEQDSNSRVACETIVANGLVILAGEISTKAIVDYEAVARQTIREIGYVDPSMGFDYRACGILIAITKQSPDIAQGVDEGRGLHEEQGAGDQGLVFGYACDETAELMPLPISLAQGLMNEQRHLRSTGQLPYLRPDAKSQVTVQYDEHDQPVRVDTVVLSTQHAEDVSHEQLNSDIKAMIRSVIPENLLDNDTLYYINPTGRFVIGGPKGDCGLTGRKLIVDTYGGMARHGGGAFSGKDPSKVDRSAAYAARYVAKNIVAAGIARRCEVQVAYAIGVSRPVSIKVTTFGTSEVSEEIIAQAIPEVFDLTPKGIALSLDLKRPIYKSTAYGGHFGRSEDLFLWEQTDRIEALTRAIEAKASMV